MTTVSIIKTIMFAVVAMVSLFLVMILIDHGSSERMANIFAVVLGIVFFGIAIAIYIST